mmetsp:Transcript_89312/g.255787  ORF Transcript_89312/g.255787 Transcript_89312/m.255787 type:complete len:355 (+) Transcript_89312:110-1174(+)
MAVVAFVGICMADRISVLPAVAALRVDGKQTAERQFVRGGGNGANSAVQCARLGGAPRLLSKVGADEMGRKLIDELRAERVDCARVTVARPEEGATPACDIIVAGATRTIISMPYSDRVADLDVAADGLDDIALDTFLRSARVLCCDGRHPAAARAAAIRAKALGIFVLVEAEARASAPEARVPLLQLLGLADGVVCSEDYPALFHGSDVSAYTDSLVSLWRALQSMLQTDAPKARFIVVTRGARGCLALEASRAGGVAPGKDSADGLTRVEVPAFMLPADQPVADTTGAGDAFLGALATCLAEDVPLGEALPVACWAGAQNCCAEGARGGMPALSQCPLELGFSRSAKRARTH